MESILFLPLAFAVFLVGLLGVGSVIGLIKRGR